MSSFLSRIKVKTGLQKNKNKFDLSCTHITTQDFFKMKPVYIKEMIPGEKINVNMAAFTRLAPMQQPMYGSVRMVNRAFFVPMRTIWPLWNNFITNSKYTATANSAFIPSIVPTTTWKQFYNLLTNAKYSTVSTGGKPDWEYRTSAQGVTTQYKFTSKGKIVWNILQGLGYKLNPADAYSDHAHKVSVMPLLAFAKLFCDWYANPAYGVNNDVEALFKLTTSTPTIVEEDLDNIFGLITKICYSADYFTSAWDNPNSPNALAAINSIDMPDITKNTGSWTNHVSTTQGPDAGALSTTPSINGNAGGAGNLNAAPKAITQYMIDALHSVTDYVKRNQLVGARTLDRYMAMFGIQLESAKLDRSVYLGKHDAPISISDVMQTAPEYGEPEVGVGNYAGKGIGYGDGNFEYSTDEYGYLIITSYMEPKVNYVDGRPRMLQHLTNFDFFTPDFDALGVQTIRKDELSANGLTGQYTTSYSDEGTFGFTPRYAEYKVALDNISGDFCLGSKNTSLEGWTLVRNYSPDYANLHSLPEVHNLGFTQADGSEYNEIFFDQTDNTDHFFTIFRFNVDSYAPMKSLYDMYDYSNEDGKDMALTLNGTQITD